MITTVLAWWQMALYCTAKRLFFLSASIKTLCGYHGSHHCHHRYQRSHRFLSCPALVNGEPGIQPDSAEGNMMDSGSDIGINVIMTVRPGVDLTVTKFIQCLSSTNGYSQVKTTSPKHVRGGRHLIKHCVPSLDLSRPEAPDTSIAM